MVGFLCLGIGRFLYLRIGGFWVRIFIRKWDLNFYFIVIDKEVLEVERVYFVFLFSFVFLHNIGVVVRYFLLGFD